MVAKKRVFLSFIEEEKQRVSGLRLLAANPDYDLEFYDESVRAAIVSRDAEYVKRRIREKINRTSIAVCLISENTHTSKWAAWELEESEKKGNTIIAEWCRRRESNPRPRDYETLALPLSYAGMEQFFMLRIRL